MSSAPIRARPPPRAAASRSAAIRSRAPSTESNRNRSPATVSGLRATSRRKSRVDVNVAASRPRSSHTRSFTEWRAGDAVLRSIISHRRRRNGLCPTREIAVACQTSQGTGRRRSMRPPGVLQNVHITSEKSDARLAHRARQTDRGSLDSHLGAILRHTWPSRRSLAAASRLP